MANKITYVKNEEPAFIKAFKQKTGYQEGPNVDSKREVLKYEDDDRSDNEEEKPTIVVLKDGDLTADEVAKLREKGVGDSADEPREESDDNEEHESDGKIKFKKPVKRQGETKSDLQTSTSKKSKQEKGKKKSSAKEVKNSSLLSFGEDEEEEDT